MNNYHCHKTCYNNLKYFVSSGEVISERISLAVLKNLLYKHIPLGMKIPNCALETLFTILLWRRLIEDKRDYSCRIVFVVNYSFVSHWKKIQVDCKFTKRHTRSPNRFELFRLMRYCFYSLNSGWLSFVGIRHKFYLAYGHQWSHVWWSETPISYWKLPKSRQYWSWFHINKLMK